MSLARLRPMSEGSRYVPPAPGRIARRVSGSATVAVLAKTRMCVVSASSNPPPKASEDRAVIVGTGSVEMRVKVLRRLVRKFEVLHAQ